MALCRFEAKIISRSGGRSTVSSSAYRSGKSVTAAAAYRHGAEMADERTGVTYDYTKKRGVTGSEIMLPTGAPFWMADRGQLWNAVEKAEKRSDAQLARDYILTLPHELDADQRRHLTREFVQKQFVDHGYVADIAWHAPHGKGDERNHHAHVMVVMRRVEADGFARTKERPPEGKHPAEHWKNQLRDQREAWANAGADALEQSGFTQEAVRFRAGHMTLEKQREAAVARGDLAWAEKLDREAEPKQGPLATKIEQQGRESHAGNDRRDVQARNADRASLKAEHAAIVAEIIDLQAEREKRAKAESSDIAAPHPTSSDPMGAGETSGHAAGQEERQGMEPLDDDTLERQHREEADKLRQVQEQDTKLQDWKRQKEQEAEDAKEREKRNQEETERKARDGEIADAQTRYSTALGQNYSVKDPYGSLAQAAMAEWSSFKKEQDDLKRQASAEQDPEKRRMIEMRREIEGCEYMAITSQRLAGMSEVIAGRRDHPSAVQDRERAVQYQQRAYELREEREELQKQQQQRERPEMADKLNTLGRAASGDKKAEAELEQGMSGPKEGEAPEMTDAKQAKLDKIRAGNEASDQALQQRQEASRQRGGQGRGR